MRWYNMIPPFCAWKQLRWEVDEKMLYDTFSAFGVGNLGAWSCIDPCCIHTQDTDGWQIWCEMYWNVRFWTIGRSQEMCELVEGSNFDLRTIRLNQLFQVLLFAKVMRDPDNGTQPWKMSDRSLVDFGKTATWRLWARHLAWLRLHFLWHLRSLRRGTGRHERVWNHSRCSIFILQACNQVYIYILIC